MFKFKTISFAALVLGFVWAASTAGAAPERGANAGPTRPAAGDCIRRDRIAARFRAAGGRSDADGREPDAGASLDRLWQRVTACHQLSELTPAQVGALVDAFYSHARASALDALRRKRPDLSVDALIADAYTRAPDRVQSDPALARVSSTALIAVNRNYNVAYQDLAFATVYDAADPATMRGYLRHFGCLKTDAVWAALTTRSREFIPGQAFPTATRAKDWSPAALTQARLALLQEKTVPDLSPDCPLSDGYAYQQFDMTSYLFGLGKSRAREFGADVSEHTKDWGHRLSEAWNDGMDDANDRVKHGWSAFTDLFSDDDSGPDDRADGSKKSPATPNADDTD